MDAPPRLPQPDSSRQPPLGIDRVELLVQGNASDLCLAVTEGLKPPVLPEVRQQRGGRAQDGGVLEVPMDEPIHLFGVRMLEVPRAQHESRGPGWLDRR